MSLMKKVKKLSLQNFNNNKSIHENLDSKI